jgi:hypoxanthine phosphoribosyltransferase
MYLESEKIQATINKIAIRLNHELFNKDAIFLVILNGSFLFAADLVRRLTINCRISFLKLSSYEGFENGESVRQLIGINEILEDKTVIIVEDIVDTGNTLNLIITQVKEKKPAEIKIVTLLLKPEAYEYPHKIDYVGFKIPDQFVVGYGLDYNGLGRNLNSIYTLVEK